MNHAEYETYFKDSNQAANLNDAGNKSVWVTNVLVIRGLYLEVVVNGIRWHVAPSSRAVTIALSEPNFI